jgi:hypothetical protein
LHRKEILATIKIAHHFGSAFNRDQLHRYLRFEMDSETFHGIIDELIGGQIIEERNSMLFSNSIEGICMQKKEWSQMLFKKNRKYLLLISSMPWVKYIGLTGANSFESCNEEDDIDLFIITSPDRLWICYLTLVLLTKLISKRETLCINFLIDENNLEIQEKNYFTAVQIAQMMPVYDTGFHKRLISQNKWIYEILPNARLNSLPNNYYLLRNGNRSQNGKMQSSKIYSNINRKIYERYSIRLRKKFPESFGKGIMLGEGMAKLNRIDNNDIYENLFTEIYEAMNS